MDASLEAKLRELIDRQEIWSVMLRYGRGLDRMDLALIRSCYHDDAIDDHHAFVGTATDFIDWAFKFSLQVNTVHHHGVNNHYCEIDGDDAHAETYYTFIGAQITPPHLLSIGRYIDHFQRRDDGVWRIANRVCVIEKLFALQEMPGGTPSAAGAGRGEPQIAARDQTDVSYARPVVPRLPLSATG